MSSVGNSTITNALSFTGALPGRSHLQIHSGAPRQRTGMAGMSAFLVFDLND